MPSSAALRTHCIPARQISRLDHPSGERGPPPKLSRLPRQYDEYRLRNILRHLRILHLPPRRGVNRIHIPPHQVGKRLLVPRTQKLLQQLAVQHRHSIVTGRSKHKSGHGVVKLS